MRTWGQLTDTERYNALVSSKRELLDAIVEGYIEMEMRNSIAQRDLDMILRDMRKNETSMELAKSLIKAHVNINREVYKLSIAIAHGSDYDLNGMLIKEKQRRTI
jgi:hypothetical protein